MRESLTVRFLAELIGTFFLCVAALSGMPFAAPITLLAQIYAFGHISGAHFNPAVTIAFVTFEARTKKFPLATAALYIVAQMLAAALAIGVTALIDNVPASASIAVDLGTLLPTGAGMPIGLAVCIGELLGTFGLATVILHVAALQGDNSFFGLAIASTVAGLGLALAKFGSNTFNPAVLTAMLSFHRLPLGWMVTFGAQIMAGAFAGVLAVYMGGAHLRRNQRENKQFGSTLEEALIGTDE